MKKDEKYFALDQSLKITLAKEKERRKRKSEEGERRREKSNGCTFSSYNGYFGESFWPEKRKTPFDG